MIGCIKIRGSVALAACIFSIILCHSNVLAASAITEVSVSSDLRRVAIKSDGRIGGHKATVMSRPSRLVIEIPAAVVAQEPRIVGLAKDSGLQVRIGKTGSAAQVALDFGTVPVPDHKVRQIDNYLIVLLGEWQPQPRAQEPAVSAKEPGKRSISTRSQKTKDVSIASGSELLIKSAEEVDGLIVLKVAKRAEPQKVYRIDLGVDFQQLGFNGANIHPVGGRRDGSNSIAGNGSSWAQPSAHGKKVGPRKMVAPAAKSPKATSAVRKSVRTQNVSALARIQSKYQPKTYRVESGRVRPYVPSTAGITRKNFER